MDFHSLARRDLQSLCKKNRVPANLTNVAMVKALEALETVEGIEEIQEALGFQSPKVKSPKLPQAGRRTSSRGVTYSEEPKIQQQPSPLSQSHGVTVKILEVTEMASKEEDIQEMLGFQSLKVNSPELPRTGRRTSVRRAALGEEPKIQQQKPLHRSRRAAAKDLEVTEMASKEEEVEKNDVPKIFPNTPATRTAVKGVEAQSSRRRAKKNEEVEDHTESPKAVEANGGKAIGVVTRRSTRLSSRNEMEETATTQSKSRSSSGENAAVKMDTLAKEDTVEKENEEEKKDLVEYGDSCAVVVEEHGKKVQEAKSHELPPIDGEDSNGQGGKAIGVVTRRSTRLSSRNEMEETATTQSKSRSSSGENAAVKMDTLAKEDTVEKEKEEEKKDLVEYGDSCAVVVEEHGKKDQEAKSHELPPIDGEDSNGQGWKAIGVVTHRSTRLSSRNEMEETATTQSKSISSSGENAAVKMETLAKEDTVEKEKEEEKKDLVEYGDSCAVIVEEHEAKSHQLPPIDGEDSNGVIENECEAEKSEDGIFKMVTLTEEDGEKQEKKEEKKDLAEQSDLCVVVAPVEGDAEKDKKAEIHAYSSFIEMENRESIVALVEEVEENDQAAEIHDFSSSTQGKGSNIEVENDNSNVLFVEGDEMKDQKVESQEYSSSTKFENEDSIAALVGEVEENDQEVKIGCSSSAQMEDSNIEVQNGDSTVVLVKGGEMKDKKVEMENKESIVALAEEVQENDREVEIHDFSSSTQGKGSNIEVENDDSIVVFVEGDEMKDKKVESQEYSSSIEVENGDSIAALVDEVEENDQEVKIHGFSSSAQRVNSNIEVQNDDFVLVKGGEMKDQKVEIKGFSSSIEIENKESIALVEEVQENDREVEIHDFSSSAQAKGSKIEVENEDSIGVFVEGESQEYSSSIEAKNGDSFAALIDEVEKNDQVVKIHGFSSSAQRVDSNIQVQNGDPTVVLVKRDEIKDQLVEKDEENDQKGEIHGFSFSSQKDSNIEFDEAFEFTKETGGNQPQENELVKDSGNQSPENEYVEVPSDPSPENKAVEYCGDRSSENDLVEDSTNQGNEFVEDSTNQGSEFVEVYDDLLPTNEAVEDSGDLSSNAGLDSLLCSEIEEEEGKLSLLFTKMTLKEAHECSDALLDASFVSKILPAPLAILQDADHVATTDIVIPQDYCSLPTNEAVEDSGDHSKAIPAGLDSLLCSQIRPLPHEEAIVCSQGFGGMEEEGKLSLVFNEKKTLKEPDECSDALLEPVVVHDASFVSKNLPAAMVIRQDADHVATADIVIPQDDCSSLVLSPAMVSLNKIPCESETMLLIEPSIVQTQSSEEAGGMAATEIEEEKEETKTKALEEEVFLRDENLELLSLTKLRAMYKLMLNGTKNEQERKKFIIKEEDLNHSSCIKHDENCKQKLNDDMIKFRKSPLIKQEDLECLSRSKLDSNCNQKLNDDKIKSERKRTPLKNLNYSTF